VNPLRDKIEAEIRERGPIPFSRYMETCLYDPEYGYYSRNAEQFGKAGDFYTSSDVHAVFGRLMARQFEEMWRLVGSPETIVVRELGPGRGLFAQDVLDWAEKKFPEFFQALRYVLVERSPALRGKIAEGLEQRIASGKALVERLVGEASGAKARRDESAVTAPLKRCATPNQNHSASSNDVASPGLPEASENVSFPTILFANEFFDALPVEIVSTKGSLRVACRNGRFVEVWVPASAEELEYLDRYGVHPEAGERVEVPLESQPLMQAAIAGVERGFAVVVDYGHTREEQLAGRHRGTLKAIRQHAVSASPYEAPGEQDITADVNFTALAAVAEQCGMTAQRLVTQSQFLMGIGEGNQFADAFEDCRLPQERTKVALQLKHLVTPAGMGESFHVMVGSKGVEKEKVERLAGLSFGRR